MKKTMQLNGYSGDEVLLYKNNSDIYVVKKKSFNIGRNERLHNQYKKHLFFLKLNNNLFSVPQILGTGVEGRLFFYEYKFIEGTTFIYFIETNSMQNILVVLDKILNILKEFSQQKTYFESKDHNIGFRDALYAKINDIVKKQPLEYSMVNKIFKILHKINNHTNKTICHGDFSFDNIIVDKNMNLWFIDFLDIFYPHYHFDISKLFQDIDGKWFELKHNIELSHNKLSYIRDYLFKKIGHFDKEYYQLHNFLLSLVFLRILPYAKNPIHQKIIKNKINYFVNAQ